jgi:hypothetical protein
MKAATGTGSMSGDAPSLAMLEFLTWVADRPRTYTEVRDGCHSCPHISVWEDAVIGGLVRVESGGGRAVTLTARGLGVLAATKSSAC